MTEQWLALADDARSDPPTVDRRIRAAVVTAMAAGIPLLNEHVSRALGADMFTPDGDRVLALALLDIYSHSVIAQDTASGARSRAPRLEGNLGGPIAAVGEVGRRDDVADVVECDQLDSGPAGRWCDRPRNGAR